LRAGFTAAPNPVDLNAGGGTVYFTNTSTGATEYLWRFGTGDVSTAPSPSYAYTQPGTYTVTLVAINFNCRDSISQTITVVRAEPQAPTALSTSPAPLIAFYPNPVQDHLTLLLPEGTWQVDVYDGAGHRVISQSYAQGGSRILDMRGLAGGYYTLMVSSPVLGRYRARLLKL